MTRPDLRAILTPHLEPDPSLPDGGVPAAVLIPVLAGADPSVIFTRRNEDMRHHSGEVSFPGGGRHAEDPDLRTTALRETHEELGIPPEAIEVLGAMEPIDTRVSGFRVVPFVGLLAERPTFIPSPEEIAAVIEVPLARLLELERDSSVEWDGFEIPTWRYDWEGEVIWGATAWMLKRFLDVLRKEGWE